MHWQALWDWLSNPSNQQTLVWIGGGAAAVATGTAVFMFLRGASCGSLPICKVTAKST
jgi:hypothetical protein